MSTLYYVVGRKNGGDTLAKNEKSQESQNREKSRVLQFFCICIFLIPILFFGLMHLFLPNELTLVQGYETYISSNIPIYAKTDTEESANVLSVTTTPLANEFQLDLGTSIVANPNELGSAEITFYLCNTIPIKTIEANVIEPRMLIPVGKAVGITLDTDGLLVLGTGKVASDDGKNTLIEPAKNLIKTGDLLLEANGVLLVNKETLQAVVKESDGEEISILLERDGKLQRKEIIPVFNPLEQEYKIGLWIRDSIQGIGTITYYDPQTEIFGALGHGVYDVDTGELMPIKQGSLISAELTEIVKGEKGNPGELTGIIQREFLLGEVSHNTSAGVYGIMEREKLEQIIPIESKESKAYPIAVKQDIQIGSATILSNIVGEEILEYTIEIQNINGEAGKEMKIEITDERLLEQTGGIVQGMSGSPILQNGKLIGAVTHVFVNDPTRGYGIFIENMLDVAS